MRRISPFLIASCAAACVVLPLLALAATPVKDYLLVKDIPFIGDSVDLTTYLQNIFRLGLGLAVTFSILMLVVNGIKYMVSDVLGEKAAATQGMRNAVVGLLIVFGSVLILSTINPQLTQFNLTKRLEETIKAINEGKVDLPQTPPGGGTPASQEWGDDSIVRDQLRVKQVTINLPNCTTRDQESRCTSVYGLYNTALAGILNLKKNCNCSLIITGGTESWKHKTHDDNQTLDFRLNATLLAYIKSQDATPENTCLGPLYSFGGAEYLLENNDHWHVCFSGACRFAAGCRK